MALKRVTFWIDEDQTTALKRIKARDGIPEAEQLRRAIRAWIDEKERASPPAERPPLRRGRKRPTGT